MKKSILGGLVVLILLSWTYAALSQRPGDEKDTDKKPVLTQNTELDDLAKRLIIQQQESRENLRRLAEGQIKSIEIGEIKPDQKQVFIKAFYTDQSTLDGRVDLESVQNKLYIARVTRLSNLPLLPGQQVASFGSQELELGRQLVESQGENQTFINDLINGKIGRLDINNIVKTGTDSIIVEATRVDKDGGTKAVKINMVFLNGYWYLKNIE